MSMHYLLTTRAGATLARAVYGSDGVNEHRLAIAHGLSYNTVRLVLAALATDGALSMSRATQGRRSITVHADSPVWAELLGGSK